MNCRDAVATIDDALLPGIRVRRCHTLKWTMTKALQSTAGLLPSSKASSSASVPPRCAPCLREPRALILLYSLIGRDTLDWQQAEGRSTKVIERLARDLGGEFPGVEGFSSRNFKCLRAFAEAWREKELCNRLLHNCRWAIGPAFWTAHQGTVPRGSDP